jgi:arabinan endo-1,5-alpha-L-arabinosidase
MTAIFEWEYQMPRPRVEAAWRRAVRTLVLAFGLAAVACGGSSGLPPEDAGGGPGPVYDAGGSAPDGGALDAWTRMPGDATTKDDGTAMDASAPVDAATPADGGRARADAGGAIDAGVPEVGAPDVGAPPVSPDASAGCGGAVLGGGPLTTTVTHLDIGVHDPSMIWDGQRYYLFATGGTLNVRSSPDILTYSNAGNISSAIPEWVTTALGTNPGSLWAPDISYFNGVFHAYYAGSTFGSNSSVIGLATTTSLRTSAWVDQQLVFQSHTSDNFNAIDPNLTFDQNCQPWLTFGSFWDGIKMRKIDATTGMLATDDTTLYSLASRGGGAIEAASIISHNGFYYLFVSFDLCCQGVSSTYRTMVGRGTNITGPYTDKTGKSMMTGAAEQLLVTDGRYVGPGGGTAWRDGNNYLYAYHYYDGDANGASKLQIRPITFDATDWIVLGDSLFP